MALVALFVSDIQERFRDLVHGGKALISTARFLIRVWTELGLPIVVTEQNPARLGKTVAELQEVLAAVPEELLLVTEKTHFSMMDVFNVHEFVMRHGVTQVVITGLETHICVLQTARDLVDHRIGAFVVVDGVTSQREFDRKIALRSAEVAGAQLTTAESIVFQVLKDAADPKFKAVAALNKERVALLMGPDDAERALQHD